ncbi:MAG: efflux RND transporter periplasmic adaptor subunit [Acidobacteriota bacterium]
MKQKTLSLLAALALVPPLLAAAGCAGPQSASASEGDGQKTSTTSKQETGDLKSTDGEKTAKKKEDPVPVEATELSRGGIESALHFSANLEAEDQVKVFSQAKRLVTDLLVEEGDMVRRGRVLLRLQDHEQRSALEKVRARLERAEREFARKERLFRQELISQQQFTDAAYDRDQLRLEMADAQRELSYTEVTAPITGTVTARLVNLGDQVQIGEHLFDLVDFHSLVARVFVPERHLGLLRPGLLARLSSEATGSEEYTGKVDRIAPIVDPKSGTVKVTIDVGGQPGLRPGMYMDVALVTAKNKDAILVPKRALVYDNDQMFVFRLGDEQRVERVFIQSRLMDKFHVEPLSGLNAGDLVVTAGQAGLKDGTLVELVGDGKGSEPTAKAATTKAPVREEAGSGQASL